MHEFYEDHDNDGNHQHFGESCQSMTPPANRSQNDKEGHERHNVAWLLPLQPGRAMRTNEPPPRIRVQEGRGRSVLRANRALWLRHGTPFRDSLTLPGLFYCVNGTTGPLCPSRYASDFGGVADAEVSAIGVVEDEGADAGFGIHHHTFG
jgi:hypothetical protein